MHKEKQKCKLHCCFDLPAADMCNVLVFPSVMSSISYMLCKKSHGIFI